MAGGEGGMLRLVRDLLLVVVVGALLWVVYLVAVDLSGPLPPLELQLAEAGAVLLAGFLTARAFSSAIRRSLRSERTARHAGTVGLFTDAVVGIAVALALVHIFGVSLESVFLGSAFAAIVVGIASQTVLANVFAGFMIILGRPYLIGDRISLVSANYGVVWPSYPHETDYPSYTGTVEEIELLYTVLRLDDGRAARVPSSVLMGAMVVRHAADVAHLVRVRLTLPHSVTIEAVEKAVASLAVDLAPPGSGLPAPFVEVADLGTSSWDAVAVVWSRNPRDEGVRDLVLRRALTIATDGGASSRAASGGPGQTT